MNPSAGREGVFTPYDESSEAARNDANISNRFSTGLYGLCRAVRTERTHLFQITQNSTMIDILTIFFSLVYHISVGKGAGMHGSSYLQNTCLIYAGRSGGPRELFFVENLTLLQH
jgi:hypothetical protein